MIAHCPDYMYYHKKMKKKNHFFNNKNHRFDSVEKENHE